MRFHDLRHSCASILYYKGWKEKDIQEWLGHSDIGTTMGIYTHISNSRKNSFRKASKKKTKFLNQINSHF